MNKDIVGATEDYLKVLEEYTDDQRYVHYDVGDALMGVFSANHAKVNLEIFLKTMRHMRHS